MAMFITWTTGVILSVVSFSSLGDGCVLGIVGDSAILPCIYNETDDLTTMNISIEWRKGNEVVHRTVLGEGTEVTQSMTYENRTQLFTDVVQKGDFSLLISDINVRDAQSYDCYVSRQGGQSSTLLCRVCLSTAAHFTHPVLLSGAETEGEDAHIICHSRGGFPEPTVHWLIDDTERPPVDTVHTYSSPLPDSALYNITSILSLNLTHDVTVLCAIENLLLNETQISASYECIYGVQTSPVVGRASQAMWMFSTFLCVTVGILVAIALGYQIKEDYSRKRARHQHQEMEDYESSTDDERQEIIMERLDILTETNV